MAIKDWRKRISGNIISFYKFKQEIRILYDYSLFVWKIVLLKDDIRVKSLHRTKTGGLKGKSEALKYAKSYMRKH